MVQLTKSPWATAAAAAAICLTLANAHPGHNMEREIAERSAFLKSGPSNLNHCAEKLRARGHDKRSLGRRANRIQELRDQVQQEKRALGRRDSSTSASASASATASGSAPSGSASSSGSDSSSTVSDDDYNITAFGTEVVNSSHLSTLDVTPWTKDFESLIYSNSSCILNPEGEIGPYYVSGELVRNDVTETQPGVPLYFEQQFIDIDTCEPLTDVYADIWFANATGVYGGVVGSGNGNEDDTSNLNNTFLRGIQATDSDGVVSWRGVFPGHYSGRATHIHIVAHTNSTLLGNDTITGGTVRHVGQLFFDQDLIDEINDDIYPYTSNTITIVDNADDRVFLAETQTDSDPVFDYVLLGPKVEDGLFAWITIGLNTSASYSTSAAAVYSADGGYETK